MVTWFDESRLDDESALAGHDLRLRTLAESGARVRREAGEASEAIEEAVARAREQGRPRTVIAAGPDSRLLRAVLEPWCPVPFVAWPGPALPGWAGSLDLVVVLAPDGSDTGTASAVAEAIRRGCQVVVALPAGVDGRRARRRPLEHDPADRDPRPARDRGRDARLPRPGPARAGRGAPSRSPRRSTRSRSPARRSRDIAVNPAKMLAIALADANPLVWGGTVLAARAARRVAESIRRASGRTALAGDAEHLLPVLEAARQRDVFDDPFADAQPEARPMLLLLDDGSEEPFVREQRGRLLAAASSRGVRVENVSTDAPSEVARYASLLLSGTYGAEYLRVGLVEE